MRSFQSICRACAIAVLLVTTVTCHTDNLDAVAPLSASRLSGMRLGTIPIATMAASGGVNPLLARSGRLWARIFYNKFGTPVLMKAKKRANIGNVADVLGEPVQSILENQARTVQQRKNKHFAQTQLHAENVKTMLRTLNEDYGGFRPLHGPLMAIPAGLRRLTTKDESKSRR